MTKIVCLVLLLAVVICSIFGLSCNQFNDHLSSLSSSIISIQDYAIETLNTIFPSFSDGFVNGDFVHIDGSLFEDDILRDLVDHPHADCYVDLIMDSYSNVTLGDDFEKGLLIKVELYSLDIKTNGEYYTCYAIRWNYVKTDNFVVVSVPEEASHLLGNRFEKNLFGLLKFNTSYAIRASRNLTKTDLTLSDIEHTCQIKTEE